MSEASWAAFEKNVGEFEVLVQHVQAKGKFAFGFVEGPLVKALRSGDWVLDEINLASPETLECTSALLHSPSSSITKDVGKKDLPPNILSLLTEIDVPPPDADRETLLSIVTQYIGDNAQLADTPGQIADGANHKPHYSMRTLARALSFAADIAGAYSLRRASAQVVTSLVQKHLLAGVRNPRSMLMKEPLVPQGGSSDEFVKFGPFYLEKGPLPVDLVEEYIMTPSVETKLIDLARIVLTRRFPVLIEGPTSSGKTSSVEYLAKRTGHRFIRINNHEHGTDIQEYLGSSSSSKWDWIVLDEFNLAPTDVLKALNRLLDDNHELIIPETQEVVRPNPHFMLFATRRRRILLTSTQAGKFSRVPSAIVFLKFISKMFHRRSLQTELETILCQRCRIAPSYGKKIVSVFRELQKRRQAGRVFETKQGFATLRDLFRWAGRDAIRYQELAENGYMLLAERARRDDDKAAVKEIIESVMGVKIDEDAIYNLHNADVDFANYLGCSNIPSSSSSLIWTHAMQRLFILVGRALRFNEPVLLVGDTGSGKTSVRSKPVSGPESRTISEMFLLDEISLAGDSVLERLNSVLEPGRSLVLAERGGDDLEHPSIQAVDSFKLIATMNPGGDYGKKELSPVLRNRFTEIWVPPVDGRQDLELIVDLSLRDILAWVVFSNAVQSSDSQEGISPNAIFHPAAHMAFLDGLGLLPQLASYSQQAIYRLKDEALFKLQVLAPLPDDDTHLPINDPANWVQFGTFAIARGPREPLLLEGNPGVGKTSLVTALPTLIFLDTTSVATPDPDFKFPPQRGFWKRQFFGRQPACICTPNVLSRPPTEDLKRPGLVVNAASAMVMASLSSGRVDVLCSNRRPHTISTRLNILTEPPHHPLCCFGTRRRRAAYRTQTKPPRFDHSLDSTSIRHAHTMCKLISMPVPSEVPASARNEFAQSCRARICTSNYNSTAASPPSPHVVPVNSSSRHYSHLSQFSVPGELSQFGGGSLRLRHVPATFSFVCDNTSSISDKPLSDVTAGCHISRVMSRLTMRCGRRTLPAPTGELTPFQKKQILQAMISYNTTLNEEVSIKRSFARAGSPWEFNLRDVLRWAALLQASQSRAHPSELLRSVYLDRFRDAADRRRARLLFDKIQTSSDALEQAPFWGISATHLQVGAFHSPRQNLAVSGRPGRVLKMQLRALETAGHCVSQSWLAIVTGPRKSGKTELVRTLANLSGRLLCGICLNSATDTMEILGSFEQVDDRGRVFTVVEDMLSIVDSHLYYDQVLAPVCLIPRLVTSFVRLVMLFRHLMI
ncbi:hypothetical protein C8R43DRAFT_1147589 [Mycena crocata]|nr:hypothetical protein C8R43DRAFT_1147589 [Mycena crocata]